METFDPTENGVQPSDPTPVGEERTPGQMTYEEMRKLMLERQEQWGPYGLNASEIDDIETLLGYQAAKAFVKHSMQIEACMIRSDQIASFVDKAVAATRRLADGMDALQARLPEKPSIILPRG